MIYPVPPVALSLLLIVVLAITLLAGCGYLSVIDPKLPPGQTLPIDTAVADTDFGAAIERGRKRIADVRSESHYPSVSVALTLGNELIWQEATGYANLARDFIRDDTAAADSGFQEVQSAVLKRVTK